MTTSSGENRLNGLYPYLEVSAFTFEQIIGWIFEAVSDNLPLAFNVSACSFQETSLTWGIYSAA
jgi:hypothetical protein